eukprot:2794199-Karenia_brevis.AAC.1
MLCCYLGPSGASLETLANSLGLSGLSGALSGTLWSSLGLSGALWDPLGLSGALWEGSLELPKNFLELSAIL